MGNTPSTPPPLVSIHAPGNQVLVPWGTNLYACAPHASPRHHTDTHTQPGSHDARTPVLARVPARRDTGRHGVPDVRIRGFDAESESTELGEVAGREVRDGRGFGARGAGWDGDARPGYAGLRGGLGPGVYPRPGAGGGGHDGVPWGMYPVGPNASPVSGPPQYASHESMPYAHGGGRAGPQNSHAQAHARPPLSSTSTWSSQTPHSRRQLPSAIQSAIDEAVKIAAAGAHPKLSRSRTAPAMFFKAGDAGEDSNEPWGDGIDTCICTNNCKCRQGERAVKWYQGTANIGGAQVPVQAKLNTRYVLKDDLGKDCGDHSGCAKKGKVSFGSASSSSSDTEVDKERRKRNAKRKKDKDKKTSELASLRAELEDIKRAAAVGHGAPYAPSGQGGRYNAHDPELLKRILDMNDAYGLNRTPGMTTTRPRMPPKRGMQMPTRENDDDEDHDTASPLVYARPRRGKGMQSIPPRRPRWGSVSSDGEASPRKGSKGPAIRRRPLPRPSSTDVYDTDSSHPRDHSALRDHRKAVYNLPHCDSERAGGISPRNAWCRRARSVGKQARVETNDDLDDSAVS